MIPHVVVDIGNSRIKWGRCEGGPVTEFASLAHDRPGDWEDQAERWGLAKPARWIVAGVHPRTREQLTGWIRQRGDTVVVLASARELPLRTRLEHPDKAGIDRLFNAVAVNARRKQGMPAIAVDAGSAVTVDCVDAEGLFLGGAIFPGLRLMARALHQETALLPLVEVSTSLPVVPGGATRPAMEAGIYWAVAGGIRAVIDQYESRMGAAQVFVGGGDAALLMPALDGKATVWPAMTLEGIRLTAEALP